MPGTKSNAYPIRHIVEAHNVGAVTAGLYLKEHVVVAPMRIGAVKVYATTAGTGGGNTVVDVLKNGVSVYAAAGDKPTLAAISTGEFANVAPATRALQPGDVIAIQVASISTTGHARLAASVALEMG